ncbi:right-handed parallel beta-helix repeat-containing protein [Paenibacillus ginsengarvi]|uniref:right-handed parallel beta-helix repeat-containing protein n=1 Tax=Paenibacillus ginsengarvi TaxID=400777 RepID=UPI00187747DD|nr:right-handed parallel beta-helix repeat-containing protein [Paenibacillus ginsengarvi]
MTERREMDEIQENKEVNLGGNRPLLTRRAMLSSLGIAGAAMAAVSVVGGTLGTTFAAGGSVSGDVYGGEGHGNASIRNVASRTALKALNTVATTLAFLGESGREGIFRWTAGDYSALIAADTAEGIFIKADAIAAATGAWVRIYDEIDVCWFGAAGDGSNTTTAFAAAISLSQFLGLNRIVCRNSTKQFKIVELQITDDIEINLGGATILGDFGAWGAHSVDAAPIYWTRNVFYSVAADAPSVTLKNMTINGQSSPAYRMTGGTPLIDFRGPASPANSKVIMNNVVLTRGSNRCYTSGSGIAAPTLLLEARNMEILLYNLDHVWMDDCTLRSSPGEMVQVQSDDARTVLKINRLYATKARDNNPSTKWSSSALNVINCHPSSEMRNSHFYFFTKGAVNWESDGGLIDSCVFDYVDDSNGLDFNEASSYRFDNHTVRNCYFRNISNVGIRTSGSNELFENNTFEDVNLPIRFEAGVLGNPARGAWLKTNQVPLVNNTVRNNNVISCNASHTGKQEISALRISSSIFIELRVEGGSVIDRQPLSKKSLFGIWGKHVRLSLSGCFGNGTTALVYLTGTATCFARDCLLAPEAGESVHVFEFDNLTVGARGIMLDNCSRITELDAGSYDFRTATVTFDRNSIHVNNSPGFAGTSNNAIVNRDERLKGSKAYDPSSLASGASVSTTVTVPGCRATDADAVLVSASVSTA